MGSPPTPLGDNQMEQKNIVSTSSLGECAFFLMNGGKLLEVKVDAGGKATFYVTGDEDWRAQYKLSIIPQFMVVRSYILDQMTKAKKEQNNDTN